jgi:hypothetical protein
MNASAKQIQGRTEVDVVAVPTNRPMNQSENARHYISMTLMQSTDEGCPDFWFRHGNHVP